MEVPIPADVNGTLQIGSDVYPLVQYHYTCQRSWLAACNVFSPTFSKRELAVDTGLAIVSLTLLLVAAVSRPLSSTPITPAMVVVAVGVLVGPLVLNDLTVRPTSSTVQTLADATLAVVLFSDSSRVNLRALRREASMPVRLLGVGLPLTIVLGGWSRWPCSARSRSARR